MADIQATATTSAPASQAKKKRAVGGTKGKAKAPASHPTYQEMIVKAVAALKEHKGASRQAVLKYIMANFKVGNDAKSVNSHLKLALRRAVKSGVLKQSKGTGATGRFRVGEKKAAPKKKKTATKAKKARKPKAAGEGGAASPKKKRSPKKKTATAKKTKSPKKAKKPKSPKKAKTSKPKSPKKVKAARPKKTKSPKKTTKKAAASKGASS